MSTVKDVLDALDRDGFYPALLTLGKVEGFDRERRLLAVAYARRVQHLMVDPRSVAALSVAERYANGEASDDELQTAKDAAVAVAWDAAADADAAAAVAWAAHAAADAAVGWAVAAAAAVAWASRAHAAAHAGREAERDWQIAELRRVCECIEAGTDPYPYPRGES